jgi:hypothetical protein
VDPRVPGDNLPPVGRSLFDFLVMEKHDGKFDHAVPFPFSALMQRRETSAPHRPRAGAESGVDSTWPIAATYYCRAGVLQISAGRRDDRCITSRFVNFDKGQQSPFCARGKFALDAAQGSYLSRLSGEGRSHRSDQLQRSGRAL